MLGTLRLKKLGLLCCVLECVVDGLCLLSRLDRALRDSVTAPRGLKDSVSAFTVASAQTNCSFQRIVLYQMGLRT